MPEKKRFQKGFFGRAGLPAALAYVNPESRNRIWGLGGGAALALGLGLAVGIWLTGGKLASSGPLSSSHSVLESDCRSCHDAFQGVSDRKCLACHGKGQPGDRSLAAHSEYRSADGGASRPDAAEAPCFGCHPEHQGRRAALASPPDEKCARCHSFEPFSAHPEFAFLVDGNQSGANPAFSHFPHLQAVAETGIDQPPGACFVCHDLRPDGISFAPTDYEVHCTDCHLESERPSPGAGHAKKVRRRDGFDHRAHTTQKTCLDCHRAIPLQGEAQAQGSNAQNLPSVEVCRECHNARLASDRCTLCHRFHPGPTAQSPVSKD